MKEYDGKMKKVNRREFLRRGSTALGTLAALPVVVPSSVRGRAAGATAPSECITMASIGNGGRCQHILPHFMLFDDLRVRAVCDVRAERLRAVQTMVNHRYKNTDCREYRDFREVLARKDIDSVFIATGDRWHSLVSIMAAKAGKDIYSEKPMSLTIEEGRALVETMKRFGTVYQCGHQRRSVDSYRFQVEVAQSGMIGKFHTVLARVWESAVVGAQDGQAVPDGFDYDMWLGATPYHPYSPNRVNGWNYFWDTGGGVLTAMGCHYTDIAQWGLDTDDTGPVEYEGTAIYNEQGMSDAPVTCEVNCRYADGRNLIIQSQGAFKDRFIRFIGSEGWIQVDDETNVMTAQPASILKRRGVSARGWASTGDHIRNFIDCIRSRRETVCSPEKSHRATTVCHVANICLRLGRKVKWNPQRERFVNDTEADRMIARAMRPPWRL